jgi:dTDP-4-dehydrorhamnose 3,5-epimerase
MKFIKTPFEGAYVIELEPFRDERGFFARTFCERDFAGIGFDKHLVQINHSESSAKGAIRGMHYQRPPASEIKIIRCIKGAAYDVMVDLRKNSSTFMQWFGTELSEDNMRMVYIPEGFAHGFQTLTTVAGLIYHHSEFYNPEYEDGLRFNDPVLAIHWPFPVSVISKKDQNYPLMDNNFKGLEI